MWVMVFAIAFVAALGFAAAAVWRSWQEFSSILVEIADTLSDDTGGRRLVGRNLDDENLLLDRMKSLHIDVGETLRTEPLLFRGLVMRCWGCESKAQCRRDLCTASVSQEWKNYCPNASMLRAMSACSISRPKSSAHGLRP
jgi:hypothetical protein